MRILFTILLFIYGCVLNAQTTKPSGFPTQISTGWQRWGFSQSDSGTIIAKRDTLSWQPRFTGTLVTRPQDRRLYFYDSVALRWYKIAVEGDIPVGTFFQQNGNSFGDTARLGTNDNFPLLFETNNQRRAILTTAGRLGIGTLAPITDIDITRTSGDATFNLNATNGTSIFSLSSPSTASRINFDAPTATIKTSIKDFIIDQPSAMGVVGSYDWFRITNQNHNQTTGVGVGIVSTQRFFPTSGTATFTNFLITGEINQTGGANGISRGLYIAPTLTSAADYRALQIDAGKVFISKNSLPTIASIGTNFLITLDSTTGQAKKIRVDSLGGGSVVARNGLSKQNDTVVLGAKLDSFTLIQTYAKKNVTPGVGVPSTALIIANTSDSLEIPFLKTGNEAKSLLYLHAYWDRNDTLPLNYGGAMSIINRYHFDSSQKVFPSFARPFVFNYGGFNNESQVQPPDTMFLQTSPFGHTGGSSQGISMGGPQGRYYINGITQTNISGSYPLVDYRAGIDLARITSNGKRETYGPGYAGYIWDWRNFQQNISGGTTEWGSYVSRVVGFDAYGLISTHSESPSKVKTLAVSRADTVMAFRARSMRLPLNEVVNGYGFVSEGNDDMNHFSGKFKLRGALPLYGTQTVDFAIDDTLATQAIGPESFFTPQTHLGINVVQNGVNNTNIANRRANALYVWKETNYDATVNLASQFNHAMQVYTLHAGRDTIRMTAAGNGDIVGAQAGMALRHATGFTDTTLFIGGSSAATSPAGFYAFMDVAEGLPNITRLNYARGYFAAMAAGFQGASWNRVGRAINYLSGVGQSFAPNGAVDTAYHFYGIAHNSAVGVRYGLYLEGSLDSNYLAGPLRLPNLVQQNLDTTTYKAVVVDAKGIVHKMYWPTGGGGGGVTSVGLSMPTGFSVSGSPVTSSGTLTVTTTLSGVITGNGSGFSAITTSAGLSSIISDETGSGSLVFGTSPTLVTPVISATGWSTANHTHAGTTTGGQISHTDLTNLTTGDPHTQYALLAGRGAGQTLIGGTTTTAVLNLRTTTGNAASGSNIMFQTGNNGAVEIARMTFDGKMGIAQTAPTARLHLGAGTATANTAPLKFTSGTLLTSAETGAMEFDGSQLSFTRASTRQTIPILEGSLTTDRVLFLSSTGILTDANLRFSTATSSLGIGAAPSSGAYVVIGAGTSTRAPIRLATGTVMTTITQGNLEVDGNARLFWSTATSAGSREQILYADSVGAIANGMIFQGNGSHVTGLALGTANQLLRVNSGATALEYFTPTYVTLQQLEDSLNKNSIVFDNPNLGDTLLVPVNDSTIRIKSLIAGSGITFNVNDSTITINGSAGTTLYSGNGTLAGNRTVTGSNNSLTFLTLGQLRFNTSQFTFSKNDGTFPYSGTIVAPANRFQFGYVNSSLSFFKGAAMFIDTNNNIALGSSTFPTTHVLYAAGQSAGAFNGWSVSNGLYESYSILTSNTTLNSSYLNVYVDATSGNVTITLPTVAATSGGNFGWVVNIKRVDASGNTVTVQVGGGSGDTIDGNTSITLASNEAKKLQSAGSNKFYIK